MIRSIHPGQTRYIDKIDAEIQAKHQHIEVTPEDVAKYNQDNAARANKPKNSIGLSEYFNCSFQLFALLTNLPRREGPKNPEWAWGNTRAIKVHDALQAAFIEAKALKIVNGAPASEMWLGQDTVPPEKSLVMREKKIVGRIDLFFHDNVFGEIKTVTDKDQPGDMWFELKKGHWDKQTMMGAYLTGVEEARIIVTNRDRHPFNSAYELECRVDEKYIEKSLARLTRIWDHVYEERERQRSGYYQFTGNKKVEYPPAEFWKRQCRFCLFGFNGSGVCTATAEQQRLGPDHPDYKTLNEEHKKRTA